MLTAQVKGPTKIHLLRRRKNIGVIWIQHTKGIHTRFLNKKMIKSKVVCNLFPGATLKDFVHYIKPILQENEFDTSVLHLGVNDILKLSANIDTVSKDINIANHCKNLSVKQIIILGLVLTMRLNANFVNCKFYQLNNSIKVLC